MIFAWEIPKRLASPFPIGLAAKKPKTAASTFPRWIQPMKFQPIYNLSTSSPIFFLENHQRMERCRYLRPQTCIYCVRVYISAAWLPAWTSISIGNLPLALIGLTSPARIESTHWKMALTALAFSRTSSRAFGAELCSHPRIVAGPNQRCADTFIWRYAHRTSLRQATSRILTRPNWNW